MDTTQQYTLENDKVLLRSLQQTDYTLLLPFALNEPNTWQYSLVNAAGANGMKAYIESALAAKATGKEYPFIVFDKRTNEYAGCTRFYDIQPQNSNLQLGYTWYGSAFRGTGLNKHCKYLLLQFAFETLGMQRVEFRADNNNATSIAAMKSIGCKVEGVLRSHVLSQNNLRRDSIILSILKTEWFENVKQQLAEKIGLIGK